MKASSGGVVIKPTVLINYKLTICLLYILFNTCCIGTIQALDTAYVLFFAGKK